MYKWEAIKVGDLGDIKTGKTPKTSKKENYGGNIPFLTPSDDMSVKYVINTIKHITEIGLNEVKNVLLPQNSVCVSCIGSDLGKVVITTVPTVTNQQINSIIVDTENYNVDFCYYLMLQLGKILNYHSKTSTAVPIINKNSFSNYDILVPELKIQEKIANILSPIDEKIAINNAINNNLEQQAQAIFKSWFIDFEPFGGTMPNDWRFVQLDEVADFVGGYSYKGNELQPSKYAMATIKNFERKGGFKLDGYKEIIPSDKCKIEQEAHLYDILVAHTDLTQNADVIGNAELLLCTNKYEKIIFSMDVVKVIPKNHMPHFILATMLKSKNFKSHCLGYVNGTTVLHLSKKALPDYIIYIPKDLSLLSKLEEFLKNIYILISNNLNENIRLTQLRDTLLPKLMSGEIDVANVKIDEKFDGSSTDKLSFSYIYIIIYEPFIIIIVIIIVGVNYEKTVFYIIILFYFFY